MECSNRSRWNVKKASSVCCIRHAKKCYAFSQNAVSISAALHERFVRIKHFHSVSQFLLYWMRIICCIKKVPKSFCSTTEGVCYRPSLIHVRVKLQIRFAQKLCGALAQDPRILGFDHLKWTCDGTFERLLSRGDRKCEQ